MEYSDYNSYEDFDPEYIIGSLSVMFNIKPDKKEKFVDLCLRTIFAITSNDYDSPDDWFKTLNSTINRRMLDYKDEFNELTKKP